MAEIIWEIQRLDSFKKLVLRLAMQPALRDLLIGTGHQNFPDPMRVKQQTWYSPGASSLSEGRLSQE